MGNEQSRPEGSGTSAPTSPTLASPHAAVFADQRGLQQLHTGLALKPMSVDVSRGIQCNLKVVIRGDTRTGKSTLFRMVQGQPFIGEHLATPQIQVENIQWNYGDSSDVIKVEFWDVVDHGLSDHDETSPASTLQEPRLLLDADTVNVYRGANAVILLFDVTREETFEYACRSLVDMPHGIPVLIMGNFSDQSDDRVVTEEMVQEKLAMLREMKEGVKDFVYEFIRYTDASLKEGDGLRFLHQFLGVPFLMIQVDTLRRQLSLRTDALAQLLRRLDTTDPAHDPTFAPIDASTKMTDTQQAEKASIDDEHAFPEHSSHAPIIADAIFDHAKEETEAAAAADDRRQRQDEMLRRISHAQWHDHPTHTSTLTSAHHHSMTGGSAALHHLYANDADDSGSDNERPNPLVAAVDEDIEEEAVAAVPASTAPASLSTQPGLGLSFHSTPVRAPSEHSDISTDSELLNVPHRPDSRGLPEEAEEEAEAPGLPSSVISPATSYCAQSNTSANTPLQQHHSGDFDRSHNSNPWANESSQTPTSTDGQLTDPGRSNQPSQPEEEDEEGEGEEEESTAPAKPAVTAASAPKAKAGRRRRKSKKP